MSHGPLDTNSAPLWAELVAAALLGSERRAPAAPAAPGALGEALGGLPWGEDAPGALLGAAAAVAAYRRAGWLPPAGAAEPLPASPPDDMPACPARAGGHLARMLGGAHGAALPEWLAALAARGYAAPAALLPALLERGRDDAELRTLIGPALGSRGRWLAGLNPAWGYAAAAEAAPGGDVAAIWETGSRAVRLALLTGLRAGEPGRARELPAASWATERAEERAAFLLALDQGLSMEDEPFLEAALDDRSERVRKVAAGLLARLPESRLAGRMLGRGAPLLSWTPARLLRRASIAVALPEGYDAAMQRDGIVRKPASASLGERAWWLSQMIELTPPAAWCAAWGASPAEILAAKIPREWRGLLLVSWAEAARRHGDQPWLAALVDLARSGEGSLSLAELLPALPADRREALAMDLLAGGGPLGGDHPALAALRSLPGVWGHALSRAVLAALRRRFRSGDEALRSDWHLRAALELFAARMPADLADEASATIPEEARGMPYWGNTITQFEELLWFRYEMLQALREG